MGSYKCLTHYSPLNFERFRRPFKLRIRSIAPAVIRSTSSYKMFIRYDCMFVCILEFG